LDEFQVTAEGGAQNIYDIWESWNESFNGRIIYKKEELKSNWKI